MPTAVSSWHPGELLAQKAMGVQDDVWGAHTHLDDHLTPQLAHFFPSLQFLPLTTLDEKRRPWVSLLAGRDGQRGFARTGVVSSGKSAMRITASLFEGLPAKDALLHQAEENGDMRRLVASVGVMLENRRRNKFEGHILSATIQEGGEEMVLDVEVDLALGNCPKYINIRTLLPSPSVPRLISPAEHTDLPAGTPLPASALTLIANADLVFLGTRHSGATNTDPSVYVSPYAAPDVPRLGCNLRGGRAGFVRAFWDAERVDAGGSSDGPAGRTCLVLPDYSGNRFFQSLGNIFLDPVAGLTIPSFNLRHESGDKDQAKAGSDLLHLTCEAEILVGTEAAKLMRGVKALVKLWVVGYTHVENALPLAQDSDAVGGKSQNNESGGPAGITALRQAMQGGNAAAFRSADAVVSRDGASGTSEELRSKSTGWSPYNPPLRMLSTEGGTMAKPAGASWSLTLHRATLHAPTLATLTWRLALSDDPTTPVPRVLAGQHLVVDASPHLDTRARMYQHMSSFAGGEKDLNDDGVRSWTISAARVVQKSGANSRFLEMDITIRRADRGAVTPGLFHRAHQLVEYYDGLRQGHEGTRVDADNIEDTIPDVDLPAPSWAIQADLLGIDGDLTLPTPLSLTNTETSQQPLSPNTLLYIVSGIGITPLLAHLSALTQAAALRQEAQDANATKVVVVLATRAGEVPPMLDLVTRSLGGSPRAEKERRPHRSKSVDVELHILHGKQTDPISADEQALLSFASPDALLTLHLHPATRLSPDSFTSSDSATKPAETFELTLPSDLSHAYICGAPAFEQTARAALSASGWKGEVRSESFAF